MRKASERKVCPDRLSELPDSLIMQILSLLEMRDVVRTTLLSKRWKDLWTTVPCLDFSGDEYPEFISGALAQWKGVKILKLSIIHSSEDYIPTTSFLDSWLLFAIEKRVEELRIPLAPYEDTNYCPPQRLYSCSSLTKLSLCCCKLKIEESVEWNQLKSLTIDCGEFFSDRTFNQLLSGAPLLEEMILCIVGFSEPIHMRSRSLKMLGIESDGMPCVFGAELSVWAPNLLSLEFSGAVNGACSFDVPSLTDAIVLGVDEGYIEELPRVEVFQFFQSILHVEKVTLSSFCIELLRLMKNNDMVVTFSNAKFLAFDAREAGEMLDVLELFPKLVMLTVQLKKIRYHTIDAVGHFPMTCFSTPFLPHLKIVEITWYLRDASIFSAIEFILQNAHLLDKLVFEPRRSSGCRDYNPELLLMVEEKMLSMPRASPTAEVILIKD